MPYVSRDPATNTVLKRFDSWGGDELAGALASASDAQATWRQTSFDYRAELMQSLSALLREQNERLAQIITLEVGKTIREARAEVEKCALVCDYYALHAAHFLQPEPIDTDAGKSYVDFSPLGVVLAVMPWNFPFWQVMRAAVPAIMAGNACVLKPASNVPQCALGIEMLFREAGFPESLFRTLLIEADRVEEAIANPHVRAVTVTGSEAAGRSIGALAGRHLKKCVLELGGSDAFVVLGDADLEFTAQMAISARFQNAGQSCIAAKRFILVPEVADGFIALFKRRVEALKVGLPTDESTHIGPLAREDLRDQLHAQVLEALAAGALPVVGCKPGAGDGFFYEPSIVDHAQPGMAICQQELFGPVAAILRAQSEQDALRLANETPFGLGASLWTKDTLRGERLARAMDTGLVFVNGIVKSDPRLPFGGVKNSGFGRELSYHGIREFVNAKTVWVRGLRQRTVERRGQPLH
ncbi:MAG: NAD-dependent succinate-semialdehyde dehydrogenase [Betaproteobacteria bacterium]|nr:NAD-dependent succinate-semialdehyde dehydrogenase [Betaproteobacteria bacterium]